jgi:hypothetical protein
MVPQWIATGSEGRRILGTVGMMADTIIASFLIAVGFM